jgi:AraC family transcriptional regulator
MTRDKLLTINADSEKSILQFSPSLPILSSQKLSWNGIKIGYYQHLATSETPEHCFSQHYITIHLNHVAVVKEQTLDGCLRCDRFRDGDICLTPATAPVSVRLHDAIELISLYLEPTFMRRIMAEVTDADSFELVPQFKLSDPLIYQIGVALKANLESPGVYDRLYIESMATAISAHLLQHYSTQKLKAQNYSNGLPQTQLRQVTEYINEHSAQNPSLMQMAEIVQMSPYYFSRLFKQSTGLTPHQYLLKCRTEQAKRLLRTTNLSIAAIATQIGFVDQSHLARHFKRYVGMPPSQFR